MKKILVFIYEQMADFEITYATHLLGGVVGKKIVTIAYENKLVRSKSGVAYMPDQVMKDVIVDDDVEGLIITGGWNGEVREELISLITTLNKQGRLLAAICAGPRFLAKAGALDDKKYTTSITEWKDLHREMFKEEDPFPRENFQMARVLTDKNIVTAQGYAFIDFAIEIIDWFSLFETKEEKDDFVKYLVGYEFNK